jgi:hypothetical protein
MIFIHMWSMLFMCYMSITCTCLLYVVIYYMSVKCYLSVMCLVLAVSCICICPFYVVICYMSLICYMSVIRLVCGGVVRIRLYIIYAHLCNHHTSYKVVVVLGTQLCTQLEVGVLGVGMCPTISYQVAIKHTK